MANVNLRDLARMTVSSTGTGTITLNAAVTSFLTFDLAGCSTAAAGEIVRYAISDTPQSEIAYGTYTSSSLTLTRGSSLNGMKSTNANAPIAMSNAAIVLITPQARDYMWQADTANTYATTALNASMGAGNVLATSVGLTVGADFSVVGGQVTTKSVSVSSDASVAGTFTATGPSGNPIHGTNTNDSAAAGYVGEITSTTVAAGAAVPLVNATWVDVASIALAAGDWDVEGAVNVTLGAGTTLTLGFTSITVVSANGSNDPVAQGNTGVHDNYPSGGTYTPDSNSKITTIVPRGRFSLAVPATAYLERYLTFGVATAAAYGYISARRVR